MLRFGVIARGAGDLGRLRAVIRRALLGAFAAGIMASGLLVLGGAVVAGAFCKPELAAVLVPLGVAVPFTVAQSLRRRSRPTPTTSPSAMGSPRSASLPSRWPWSGAWCHARDGPAPRPACCATRLLSMLIGSLLASISVLFNPMVADLHNRERGGELDRLFKTSTRWLFMLGFPLCLMTLLFAPDVMRLFGQGFAPGAAALAILAVGQLVNVGTAQWRECSR